MYDDNGAQQPKEGGAWTPPLERQAIGSISAATVVTGIPIDDLQDGCCLLKMSEEGFVGDHHIPQSAN